jgi:hypothetical protein
MRADGPRPEGRRRPAADGWRERAAAHGSLRPDPSPVLTASEIGSFAFCRQAWYLRRCGVVVAPEAELRLAAGSDAHRALGRTADLVGAAGAARRLTLVAIAVLVVLLVLLAVRGAP